jgi:hypothetical protein
MKFDEEYNDNTYIESKDRRKIVVLKDPKGGNSKYTGKNIHDMEIAVYRIDGGIITAQREKKCDYGLYTADDDTLRFIELKGSDFEQAIKQITNTLNELIHKQGIDINRVCGRIVLSRKRVPQIKSNNEKKLVKLLHEKHGDLITKTQSLIENIE